MERRSTIVDVAAEAGLSIKTVSRVLNDEPHVRQETRDRVMAAARALTYHPNVAARGLAGRRSYLIGLLYENPSANYVLDVQRGAAARLHGTRYRLTVLPVGSVDAIADDVLALVRAAGLDAVLLPPPACDNAVVLDALAGAGFPFARIAPATNRGGRANTTTDDVAGGRDITAHLLALGHRRIGMVLGDPTHAATEARRRGYLLAHEQADVPVDPSLTVPGAFTFDSGREAGAALLARADPPTAIFAQNDDMAAGVLSHAYEQGIAVPGVLSVAGYDDTEIARMVWPRLTTMHQPTFDLAHTAAAMLLAMLDDEPYDALVTYPTRLVERESTGPAPR